MVRPGMKCLVLAGLFMTGGCVVSRVIPAADEGRFLTSVPQDGKATRSEVTRQFGTPHASFESGRIVTYRLNSPGPRSYVEPTPHERVNRDRKDRFHLWEHSQFSLVIVFDGDVMKRHSLIEVR